MTATVDFLPVWKKGSTAEEWLYEIAAIARKYPERFEKAAVVFEETKPSGNTHVRYHSRGTSTTTLVGLLEIAKVNVIDDTRAQ